MINFDDYIEKEDSSNYKGSKYFKPNSRYLIIAPSGGGKTNLLLNLLFKHLYFDKIYLYARDLSEDKYQFLIKHFEDLELKLNNPKKKKKPIKPIKIIEYSDKVEDIPDPNDVDKNVYNIIIFDDFVLEKKNQKIVEWYIRGRKRNATMIYLTQSYFSTPKNIRLNANYFMLSKITTKRELDMICADHCIDLSKEEFKNMYNTVNLKPYQFLTIDKLTADDKLKYRLNFDEPLLNSYDSDSDSE